MPSAASVRAASRGSVVGDTVESAGEPEGRGEGGWAWNPDLVDWQGNEVELLHEGGLLRMDRLVRRRDSGEWWVLDFKSASRPQEDPALRAQMRRYQLAVRAATPGAVVRAAFLTGQGRLVEVT